MVGVLDGNRAVLLDEIGGKLNAWIDIVFVPAERLVEAVKPIHAVPAKGWHADAAFIGRLQQFFERSRCRSDLFIVEHETEEQETRRNVIVSHLRRIVD